MMSRRCELSLMYDGRLCLKGWNFVSSHVDMKAVKLPHWETTGQSGVGIFVFVDFRHSIELWNP